MPMTRYDYASGDLLAAPNTYFFSRFEGTGFLRAWEASRRDCAARCGSPADRSAGDPLPPAREDEGPTLAYLRAAIGTMDRGGSAVEPPADFDLLLRNFEAKRRVYRDYAPGFVSKGRHDHDDLRVYVALAQVLARAAEGRTEPRYLNALLKCLDIVCAMRAALDPDWASRVPAIVDAEARLVRKLAQSLEVRW